MHCRTMISMRLVGCAMAIFIVCCAMAPVPGNAAGRQNQPAGAAPAAKQTVGTIRSINGRTISLAQDSGATVTVQVKDPARIVRVEPGQTDLKNASPIHLSDLQVGDRVLVRGQAPTDGTDWSVNIVVAMKRADLQAQQRAVMEDWRKRGVGGLVKSVDDADGTIRISMVTGAGSKIIAIHTDRKTAFLRYVPDSVKMADAKAGLLSQIKPGDQLQARGEHSADGTSVNAEEVVSGSFRNISGTVVSVNPEEKSLTINDLATKKPVVVEIGSQSQLRKLPAPLAMGIAARLKAVNQGQAAAVPSAPQAGSRSAGGEAGGGRAGAQIDFQQVVNRSPAVMLTDLQKGDAVMIVGSPSDNSSAVTAIMLVSGVEPILTAPNGGQAMTLAPWSLGGTGDAEAAP